MIVGEVVVGHAVYLHQGMVVEGELTEGVNMEDPGHPTDIEMTTETTGTEEDPHQGEEEMMVSEVRHTGAI